MRQIIQHSVWPTGVPPVCVAYWDQRSWDLHADAYRPADYHGDRFDAAAWDAYAKAKRLERQEALRQEVARTFLASRTEDERQEWLHVNREANT